MTALATRCETAIDDSGNAEMLNEALSLMLEIRVPRMPDTAAELQEMLAEAQNGPTFSSEEVWENLRRHSALFGAFLETYRQAISDGEWEMAVRMLLPHGHAGSPRWTGASIETTVIQSNGLSTATIVRRDDTVAGRSQTAALALVGAIMLAHIAWRETWWR